MMNIFFTVGTEILCLTLVINSGDDVFFYKESKENIRSNIDEIQSIKKNN